MNYLKSQKGIESMRKFLGLLAALPLWLTASGLSGDWAFYEAPFATWDETDVAASTGTPEKHGKASRQSVRLADGVFVRETAKGKTSLLVHRFEAPSDGTLFLRCGANCFFIEAALNGKKIWECRTSYPLSYRGEKGSHILKLDVKKGSNLFAVKFFGSSCGFADKKIRFFFACDESTEEEYLAQLPTSENFAAIGKDNNQHLAECIIRNGVDQLTATAFAAFDREAALPAAKLETLYAKYPVLAYYDRAIDKLLYEIPATKVERGIVVWHLYNMGYVVKTPECCFGIDLHHRRAAELAPLLDFILVTHNHSDHYNLALLQAMSHAKKPVVSNFYPSRGYQRPPQKFEIADVTIETGETDHNATLKKFMSTYRITCGRTSDAPVLYHTGDSCDFRQLQMPCKADVWIVHPQVGILVPEAAKHLLPKEIWFSHLLEMGHCKPSIYRPIDWITFYCDQAVIQKQNPEIFCRAPMWGEKIVVEKHRQ